MAQHVPTPQAGAPPSAHVSAGNEVFVLRERIFSFSGDDFRITDRNERPRYLVHGKFWSLHARKTINDLAGQALYELRMKAASVRRMQYILDVSTGTTVCTMRKKNYIGSLFSSTFLVWKGDSDVGEPWLQVTGDIFKKDFEMVEVATGAVVARVMRHGFNLRTILCGQDTYVVEIMSGNDVPMILMVVVGIDEAYRENKDSVYG